VTADASATPWTSPTTRRRLPPRLRRRASLTVPPVVAGARLSEHVDS
jgi:hypothetical protein